MLTAWRAYLAERLGCATDWPEAADLPYWTDRPTWDGFGAVVVTAARIERPDHPGAAEPGPPDEYASSPLVEALRSDARRFRSLLLGAQWWLPIDSQIKAFHGGLPNGTEYVFATVDLLVDDLSLLAEESGLLDGRDPVEIRRGDHPTADADVDTWAAFGLAVMVPLARLAQQHRMPMLMDD